MHVLIKLLAVGAATAMLSGPAWSATLVNFSTSATAIANLNGVTSQNSASDQVSAIGDQANAYATIYQIDPDTGALVSGNARSQAVYNGDSGTASLYAEGLIAPSGGPAGLAFSGSAWNFTFKADEAGLFTLNYDFGGAFNFTSFDIGWAGDTSESFAIGVNSPPSGVAFSRSLTAGQQYALEVRNVSFLFSPADFNSAGGGANFRYAITAIPEPASWALMITGFFGMGSALRRSRRQAVLAAI
ncbi:MAG: PEPxxWA-CTERM sorting domain-containing protein [Alphaproteobacteria bacterium]|nr:PEPxxWA-CTERM sorting domain-containing protein [Alphaproteobacteria bacterium]MBU1514132.1 PEPxxWA-CTERM sorting domain-containing protein [Alphaproteobacteria bacterium]MBU2096219.1 PEPxxWA-CTERM sorting domain-containing protein [Alphaproteobacteria bacterium]MBU2151173.1 PEPxxWA-CTERM sorting domain-containing protein [Alphaproteobacteria bacterium]MBU2307168.1 PEPxxWA-CTERM sorting domain-containing protein [Alphaproteobacteria bacterium]